MNFPKDPLTLLTAAIAVLGALGTAIRNWFKLSNAVRSNTQRITELEKSNEESQRVLGLIEVKLSELAAFREGDENRFADLKHEVTAQGDRLEARINRLEKDHF